MNPPIKYFYLLFIFLFILWFAVTGCEEDSSVSEKETSYGEKEEKSGEENTDSVRFTFIVPSDSGYSVAFAARDAAQLLGSALGIDISVVPKFSDVNSGIVIAVNEDRTSTALYDSKELDGMPPESFRIRRSELENKVVIAVAGADERGTQYGIYDLLEIFGFRFFHPEMTYRPRRETITVPEELDIFEKPDYPRRGFHIHTMHPIEATEFLQRSDPEYLNYSKHLIDWHIRNKQNYMQWELLREVDFDAEVEHFKAIADYAHSRKMDLGIVVSWVFQQQKAWKLVPNLYKESKEEMERNLDQLMQVPWDHINLEMGSSEFTQVSDVLQVKWMNNTVEYLSRKYPYTEASVKVHCSSGQTAPSYGDINFNYLAQEADPKMGIYPHTVMFYDLAGPVGAYDNENFDDLFTWMKKQIGKRKVYYYPETAYWCSLDIDVPLFLPVYLFNRWKDIVLLSEMKLDGHVNFTSGHEWGYWLNDWVVAISTWDAQLDWRDILADYSGIFGSAGEAILDTLVDLTLYQEKMFITENLISYIAGQDSWDEIGYLVGTTTHPRPVLFSELYKMDEYELAEFHDSIIVSLKEIAQTFEKLHNRVASHQDRIPVNGLYWFDELQDCFATNLYRAQHAYYLFQGAYNRRMNELGLNEDGEEKALEYFDSALAVSESAIELMRDRENYYRYPLDLSIGWERSLTSYDFKYLWQASTGYWYRRYEAQAIDKNFNIMMMNVIDPVWFFF